MSDEVYRDLAKFLDRMPGGFPKTESGVELKILKKLFTPEQAKIAMGLTPFPEPAAKIAARLKMDEAQAAAKLEQMAREGSIYRVRAGANVLYVALNFVVGIYEFHLNSIDRELAELMEEYLPHLKTMWEQTRTKQLRVVPIHSAVASAPAVSTYDQVRELTKKHELISVAPCICRKEQALLDNPCERPLETCLQFGMAAQYYIENGLGRKITSDELMDILKMGEEKALVLSPTNAQDIVNICMCCGCCCGVLRGLKAMPRPAEQVQSSFQARIDPGLCSACGTCLDRCQMDAIVEGDVFQVDAERCIGCGLCLPTCPEQAVYFVPVERPATPPANIVEMNMRIGKERGVL
jgi:electron transport complex protein RnfB